MASDDIYARQGMGQRLGPGCQPALITVDFVNGFVDPAAFGGGNIAEAVACTVPLLEHARTCGWPIVHTRVVYAADGADCGVFALKASGLRRLVEDDPISHVVDELAPEPGEYVLRKTQASAFFGTDLAPWLTFRGVDTLVVTGATTSGCVRATVVDACSHNFRPMVITDCVGDRAFGPHEANLFDMAQKYADLMTSAEAMATWP